MEVYISNISFATGKQMDIGKLTGKVPEKRISLFRKFGLGYYHEYKGSIYELALETGKKTVDGRERDIGRLVFATGSFHSPPSPYNRIDGVKEMNHLLKELKIDAYPYGVYLSDCANIMTAIRIGRNFLLEDRERISQEGAWSSERKDICIITTDVTGETESRIVPPGTSIKSDSAASCILSVKKRGPCFKVENIHQFHNKDMLGNEPLAYESYITEVMKCNDFIRKKNLGKQQQFKYILTNNYSKSYIKTFASSLQTSVDIFYQEQIENYAHCFSSDLFVNLSHLLSSSKLEQGDKILAIASGPSSISSVCLTYYG